MKNVILVPHIGSASVDTRIRMSELAATNIINVLEGNDKKALLVLKRKVDIKNKRL